MLAFYMTYIEDDQDKDKFVVIYKTYVDSMVKIADNILKDYGQAEDAVHEAFLYILSKLKVSMILYRLKRKYWSKNASFIKVWICVVHGKLNSRKFAPLQMKTLTFFQTNGILPRSWKMQINTVESSNIF